MDGTERELRRKNAAEQLRHDRYIRRMEKKEVKQKQQGLTSWILEFSKKVVVLCVLLHAAVFLYSAVVMWRMFDISALPTIVAESSEVLRTCVFGYMVKAGMENWQKIRNNKSAAVAQPEKEEGKG